MSGNLTAVRETSGILLNVRDSWKCQKKMLSWKSCLKLCIVRCKYASILDFAEFVYFILVYDHALLHSNPHH